MASEVSASDSDTSPALHRRDYAKESEQYRAAIERLLGPRAMPLPVPSLHSLIAADRSPNRLIDRLVTPDDTQAPSSSASSSETSVLHPPSVDTPRRYLFDDMMHSRSPAHVPVLHPVRSRPPTLVPPPPSPSPSSLPTRARSRPAADGGQHTASRAASHAAMEQFRQLHPRSPDRRRGSEQQPHIMFRPSLDRHSVSLAPSNRYEEATDRALQSTVPYRTRPLLSEARSANHSKSDVPPERTAPKVANRLSPSERALRDTRLLLAQKMDRFQHRYLPPRTDFGAGVQTSAFSARRDAKATVHDVLWHCSFQPNLAPPTA